MRFACSLVVSLALTGVAAAQAVPVADLVGTTIEVSSTQDMRVRREGRELQLKSRRDFVIVMRSPDAAQVFVNNIVEGRFGRRENSPGTATFPLGQERRVGTAGGGTAMWAYTDGTLTFMRTFQEGALRLAVPITRTDGRLTCSVTEGFAREDGKSAIIMSSPIDGAPVRVLDAKQSASSCKVIEAR